MKKQKAKRQILRDDRKDSTFNRIGTLYAQELPNGYQLVDSTPKIRMKIEKTSMPDFYLAKAGDTSGVVFKKMEIGFLNIIREIS